MRSYAFAKEPFPPTLDAQRQECTSAYTCPDSHPLVKSKEESALDYFRHFVARSPTTAFDVPPQDFFESLPSLLDQAIPPSSIIPAITSLALAIRMPRSCPSADEHKELARSYYGEAISLLQGELNAEDPFCTEALLASIQVLSWLEVMHSLLHFTWDFLDANRI